MGVTAITGGDVANQGPSALEGPGDVRRRSNQGETSSGTLNAPAPGQETDGEAPITPAEDSGKTSSRSLSTKFRVSSDPITDAAMAEEQVAASKALVTEKPETAFLIQANVTPDQVAGLFQ